MLLAGIVGQEGMMKIASLISSFFVSTGKKVSVADLQGLIRLDFNRIKSYISELEKNKTDILLLKLNEFDVEKLVSNGVFFDVMIFTGNAEINNERELCTESFITEKLNEIMSERGITIVNVDDRDLISMLDGKMQRMVTYGFNSKASVTTSSIGDTLFEGSFICCLQRTIPTRNGKLVEPQEYKLHFEPGMFDTHNILAAASFAIVNGVDINGLSCI